VMLLSIPSFWKAQMSDWKVTVVRTSLERLGYQIIYPYLSLYIVALGAQKTQLGLITSISMILAGLLGPVTGFFIDRNGAKKVYIAGILMLFVSYMLYASAPTWHLCVLAMIVYYLGSGTGGHSCGTICGNCLANCDRAKGMLICESLAAGLLGMIGPMIAAFLLVRVIGVDEAAAGADELKYLFYVSAFFTLVSLLVVVFKLSNQKWAVKNKLGTSAVKQGIQILRENKYARRWIVISAVNNLPMAMVLPYTQVFAGEVKGASVTVLAAMVTACSLTSVFCGYPVGALADRFGRKKVLYVILPLYWLSNILLILAPSPAMLIIAGILSGFYYISSPLSAALISGFFGLCFGLLCSFPYIFIGSESVRVGLRYAVGWWIAGIPWDILHGVSNFAIMLALWAVCAVICLSMRAPPVYTVVPLIPITIFFGAYGLLNTTVMIVIILVSSALVAAEFKRVVD